MKTTFIKKQGILILLLLSYLNLFGQFFHQKNQGILFPTGEGGFSKAIQGDVNGDGFIDFLRIRRNNIVVFPNPTNGYVHFNGLYSNDQIKIYNLLGAVLYNSSAVQKLNVSHYAKGIYIIEFKNDNGEFLKQEKLIIN